MSHFLSAKSRYKFPSCHSILAALPLAAVLPLAPSHPRSALHMTPEPSHRVRQITRQPPYTRARPTAPQRLLRHLATAPTQWHIVTSASAMLDPQLLSLLPPNTVVIHSNPIPHTPALIQLPPVAKWTLRNNTLVTSLSGIHGRRNEVISPWRSTRPTALAYTVSTIQSRSHYDFNLTVKIPLRTNALKNGNFRHGLWGRVGDCDQARGASRRGVVHASLITAGAPDRLTALRLTASADTACESTPTTAHASGAFLLDLWTRRVQGSSPSLCLWEAHATICDPTVPPLPNSLHWHHYQAVIFLQPPSLLFLYAGPANEPRRSVDEYAAISLHPLPYTDLPLAILAYPIT